VLSARRCLPVGRGWSPTGEEPAHPDVLFWPRGAPAGAPELCRAGPRADWVVAGEDLGPSRVNQVGWAAGLVRARFDIPSPRGSALVGSPSVNSEHGPAGQAPMSSG